MKKTIIFILLITTVALISCDDFLDVMPDNRTELDTKEKISKLLVSAYPETSAWMIAEFSSDNTDDNTERFSPFGIMDQSLFFWKDVDGTSQDTPQAFWEGCYGAIAASNQALDAIEKLGNEDGDLNAQKGEALITRAYGHFLLANIFCKHYNLATSDVDLGLPYMESPEKIVWPKYRRGTVAELYEKMNRDIEAGLPLINDNAYTVPKYHFNKQAAYAFAARFNLYYGKYNKVIDYANIALNADVKSSLRNWQALGAIRTDWELRGNEFINASNPANLLLTSTVSYWPIVHGPFTAGTRYSHGQKISDYETTGSNGPWGTYNSFYCKYSSFTGNNPKYSFVKYFRYIEYTDAVAGIGVLHMVQSDFTADEALLNRAEAYALLGEYEAAAKDIILIMNAFSNSTTVTRNSINTFYASLGYYTPQSPTPKKKLNPDFVVKQGEQENLIHCILHMRRIICLHEGLRWNDVKRYGIDVYRRKVDGNIISVYGDYLGKKDPRRALQLPKNVISAGLEANPR